MNYDVYLAAPFFSESERTQNSQLLEAMETASLRVFYPARDGIIAKDELRLGRSTNEVLTEVWRCDTAAIRKSTVLIAVLDGRTVDEGVCVEIGFASALSKAIVGFSSDERICFTWGLNPMLSEAITSRVSDIDSAVEAVLRCVNR